MNVVGGKSKKAVTSRFGRMSVADYLDYQIVICGKTQREIAEESGFPKANIITMFKTGRTKVPLERVPALADALGVSRTYLMRLVLGEDHPALLSVMEEVFGYHVSDNEFSIIAYVREVSGYSDPGMGGKDTKWLLKEIFGAK